MIMRSKQSELPSEELVPMVYGVGCIESEVLDYILMMLFHSLRQSFKVLRARFSFPISTKRK